MKVRRKEIEEFVLNNTINKLNFLKQGKGLNDNYRNENTVLKLKKIERENIKGGRN